MTINNKSIFLIVFYLLCGTDVSAYKPGKEQKNKELDQVVFRSLNYALKNEDYEVIKTYINNFLIAKHPEEVDYPVSTVLKVVKFNQPPEKILRLIQKSAIAAKSFEKNSDDLTDIIWWSEVRLLKDIDLNIFLQNQLNSSKTIDALAMLVENGDVESLKQFTEMITNEFSPIERKYYIRQAETRKLLIEKGITFESLITKEVKQSLSDYLVFNTLKSYDKLERKLISEHLKWLIKQLGINRENDIIKNILGNLSVDTYHYNRAGLDQALKDIPNDQRMDFLRVIENRLELKDRIYTALNPYSRTYRR